MDFACRDGLRSKCSNENATLVGGASKNQLFARGVLNQAAEEVNRSCVRASYLEYRLMHSSNIGWYL